MFRWVVISSLVCSAPGWARTPEPGTQPATAPSVPSPGERLALQIALIEDSRNPPETRRAIARELLLQGWPEAPARLATVLAGSSEQARIAVASALLDLPALLDPVYLDPLLGMLADASSEVRSVAGQVLASYGDVGVIARLRVIASDSKQPRAARLGAIGALALMTERAAVDALAELLYDGDPAVADAAMGAFQRSASMDFADDRKAAQAWWMETRSLSDDAWGRLQTRRLIQRERELNARLAALEARLGRVLEANFQRSTDGERAAQVAEYLADPSLSIRLLGLRLVQQHVGEGRPHESVPRELVARIRELMNSRNPVEQAEAVRAVASFRQPADGETFKALLPQAVARPVQLALINALGYCGDASAVGPLVGLADSASPEVRAEVIAALGRLAERDVLTDASHEPVVGLLLQAFKDTPPAQVAVRERIVWAMGNVGDPDFADALATALERTEAVAVRQQAVRAIALLKDAKLADALVAATGDPDTLVRRTAVETLSSIGSSERHLQALWARLSSPPEADEAVRQAAWRGALTLLLARSPAEIDAWIGRLPGDSRQRAQRTAEILQRLLAHANSGGSSDRADVALLHARLAAQYAALDQVDDAQAEFEKALAELRAAGSPQAEKVAAELLRFALTRERYDRALSELLAKGAVMSVTESYWRVIKEEVEVRMTPDAIDSALFMLDSVQRWPPGEWSDAARQGLLELYDRAVDLKVSTPTTRTAQSSVEPA